MSAQISIRFDGFDREIVANIVPDLDTKVLEMVKSALSEPQRLACDHTISTGDYFLARARPPRNPVQLGSQATPLGGKTSLLSQLDAGDILYPGGKDLSFAYGPDITEPLMSRGPVVAKVIPEHLEDFFKAGRLVWDATSSTHKLMTITVTWKA